MRGDIYLANLTEGRGSEQAGTRPVIIVQNNNINRFTRTVIVIPLTTNLRRTQIPGTIIIPAGEGGLNQESVALCYQIIVIDRQRLRGYLGTLSDIYLQQLADAIRYTLDII
ncbi:type II toxin-antitoxin system PemK/MazF family toxin [Aphanothece sacrum]|uniref:mRNA interferase n=1 Tax=Aphanothece sacrum FPU1 TaxID=1920663 RepID=A0A401ILT7_APHSA|nr:type II toxin-antitoxin system PemK/MazF family toxin [Aphanothece sacrum]GBF82224.1 mRNA interferase [Aphanothece sacrum FPU1]GBF87238.1 mRNA interferase [Aphanothece sacrum FPU3]